MGRFDLTDNEWSIIEPLLQPRRQGPQRRDDRQVLNGIFFVLRTGIAWDNLPERYGPAKTAYNHHNLWEEKGVWKAIFDALATEARDSLLFIDSSVVKAHRSASGAKGGSWHKVLAARVEAERQKYMWPSIGPAGRCGLTLVMVTNMTAR